MSFVRELRAKFTAGAEGFRRTINEIRNDMGSIGDAGADGAGKADSAFSKLKKNIIGFGGAYLGFEAIKGSVMGLGQAMIGGNADMEQYQNTLTQVMHSSEKAAETLEWATGFAAQTPFEIPDIVEATTKLEIYGLTAKDNLGTIGDMASVMGKPLMQAVEAIADAQTGELERLKEFGITKQMLIDQAAKMGKNEVVNAKGQITDQKALNDALFALMQDRYQGGMELQSKTFKGMVSNIQDSMGTMARELGKPIFEGVKRGAQTLMPVLGAMTQMIRGDTTGAVKSLTDSLGPEATGKIMAFFNGAKTGFNVIKDAVLAAWPIVVDVLKTLWNVLEPIATLVGGALYIAFQTFTHVLAPILQGITGIAAAFTSWEGFGPLVMGLVTAFGAYKAVIFATTLAQRASTIATNAMMIATRLLNLTMMMNPIGLVVAAIVGLGVALYAAYQKSETFRNIVNSVWEALKTGFMAVINWFTTTLPAWIASIVAWFTEMKDKASGVVSGFVDGITGIFKKIGTFIMPIIDEFKNFFIASWENLKLLVMGIVGVFLNLLVGDFEGVKVSLLAIWDAIWSQVKNVINTAKRIITLTVTAIKAGALAGFNALKNGVSAAINGAKNAISSAMTGAKNLALGAINGMRTGISNGITRIKEFFTGMKDTVIKTVKSIDLMQIGKDIMNGLINGISSMGKALKNKVTGMAKSVTDSIKGTLGINSPSKVTTGFGVNIGEGLAIGMDKARRFVGKAADTLAGLTIDPFSTPDVAPIMGSSLATAGAAAAGTGGNQYNAPLMHVENQYVNDQNDVREISTGLYGLQRSYDRSKGRR